MTKFYLTYGNKRRRVPFLTWTFVLLLGMSLLALVPALILVALTDMSFPTAELWATFGVFVVLLMFVKYD